MDRAGSVKDILSVAKELGNVRQSIEQIDAQSKSLQNQVAYSAIALNLEASASSTSIVPNLGTQVQETWKQSTHSFGELTISLLQLGIWLLVYTHLHPKIGYVVYPKCCFKKANVRSLVSSTASCLIRKGTFLVNNERASKHSFSF